jgi:DNA repair protein RadC
MTPDNGNEQATIAAALDILRKRTEAGVQIAPGSAALDAVLAGLRLEYAALENEHMGAIWLDCRARLLSVDLLAQGSVNAVRVPWRDLVKAGLAVGAEGCILWHTHPGGDARPSGDDVRITADVEAFLHRLDIRLLDHVVLATEGTRSIAAESAHRVARLAGRPVNVPAAYSGTADIGPPS